MEFKAVLQEETEVKQETGWFELRGFCYLL
jgi:hypothetical protein